MAAFRQCCWGRLTSSAFGNLAGSTLAQPELMLEILMKAKKFVELRVHPDDVGVMEI